MFSMFGQTGAPHVGVQASSMVPPAYAAARYSAQVGKTRLACNRWHTHTDWHWYWHSVRAKIIHTDTDTRRQLVDTSSSSSSAAAEPAGNELTNPSDKPADTTEDQSSGPAS